VFIVTRGESGTCKYHFGCHHLTDDKYVLCMIPVIKESLHREEEIKISHENARKPF
jgi:hypothetical protein